MRRTIPSFILIGLYINKGPSHAILVLIMQISYAQMPSLNTHIDVFSGTRGIIFSLSFRLHQCLMYVISEGSGESAYLHKLARAVFAEQCDMDQNL